MAFITRAASRLLVVTKDCALSDLRWMLGVRQTLLARVATRAECASEIHRRHPVSSIGPAADGVPHVRSTFSVRLDA